MTRDASQPAAGAARGGLAGLLGTALAGWVTSKTGSSEGGIAAGTALVAVLTGVGKEARNRDWPIIGTIF